VALGGVGWRWVFLETQVRAARHTESTPPARGSKRHRTESAGEHRTTGIARDIIEATPYTLLRQA